MNSKGPYSLQHLNTFGIDVHADTLTIVEHISDLNKVKDLTNCLILGGGSNVLFTGNISGEVMVNRIMGIDVIQENDDNVQLEVASGEQWHDLVMYCISKGYGGIENLSLIPGSVGAAPMQNIGAYGVEVKDVIDYVKVVDRNTLEERTFLNSECNFGYRESIFKNIVKGQYFITAVGLTLTKKNHRFNTSYGAIQDVLREKGIEQPTIADVSEAVISIRRSKLPDPADLGNSGSFFKNPVISKTLFDKIKEDHPEIRSYPVDDDHIKVPAGWLIEQTGWKGKRVGNTGSHRMQSLVLVNYGGATGKEVFELSKAIRASVKDTFGIDLETEVNIIGS